MTEDAVLVTGAQRSGTSLLATLLNLRDDVSLLSQPFPFLFTDVKRLFLRTLGHDDRYPLGHLFLERRYSAGSFARFLGDWRITHPDLRSTFARMKTYSGQYTRVSEDQLEAALPGIATDADFAQVVASLDRLLAAKTQASLFGSKETTCEEYVPALLDRGFRCVIIIRDPRDVLASLNHGRGAEYAGEPKPTLFNIRSWRKSAAFVLAMEGHPRFRWCRYEDLVQNPAEVLSGLGLGEFDLSGPRAAQIRESNSSHGEMAGISTASVGAYRHVLPAAVAESVEAACLPELCCLGYPVTLDRDDAVRVLSGLREHYVITRPGMDADAPTDATRAIEVQRLHRLSLDPDQDVTRWFLFDQVHARLREAWNP